MPNIDTRQERALVQAVNEVARQNNWNPSDVLTIMSFETAATLNPWQKGPETKWGTHRGLIQWGEPQAAKYGVTKDTSIADQVRAAAQFMIDHGVKKGDGILSMYAAINAGDASKINASDTAAGGTWGTVSDKVNHQMGDDREIANALLAKYGTPDAFKTAIDYGRQALIDGYEGNPAFSLDDQGNVLASPVFAPADRPFPASMVPMAAPRGAQNILSGLLSFPSGSFGSGMAPLGDPASGIPGVPTARPGNDGGGVSMNAAYQSLPGALMGGALGGTPYDDPGGSKEAPPTVSRSWGQDQSNNNTGQTPATGYLGATRGGSGIPATVGALGAMLGGPTVNTVAELAAQPALSAPTFTAPAMSYSGSGQTPATGYQPNSAMSLADQYASYGMGKIDPIDRAATAVPQAKETNVTQGPISLPTGPVNMARTAAPTDSRLGNTAALDSLLADQASWAKSMGALYDQDTAPANPVYGDGFRGFGAGGLLGNILTGNSKAGKIGTIGTGARIGGMVGGIPGALIGGLAGLIANGAKSGGLNNALGGAFGPNPSGITAMSNPGGIGGNVANSVTNSLGRTTNFSDQAASMTMAGPGGTGGKG